MAKRKSTNAAHGEDDHSRRSSSKRHRSTATTTNEAPATPAVKTEEPTILTERKTSIPKPEVAESVYDVIVDIYIGPAMVKFGIYAGVLRRASSFFKEILGSGVLPEANDDIVTFEDGTEAVWLGHENPAIFARFRDWLYTSKVTTDGEKFKHLSWTLLIDVYTFAERRGVPNLQNSCINAVIGKRKSGGSFPGQDIITPLWKNHGQVWPLRRLILHLFAAQCDLKTALGQNSAYPQRFLHDLVIILYERKMEGAKGEKVDFWKEREKYYVYKMENPIALD